MEKQSLAIILANCFKAIAPLGWLALASACVHGQSVPEKYKFSPPAQTVIDRLESIETMPANEWQYHAGDLAHGESTDPDTTPWTSIQLPFVASKQEIWLRRWVVVPKDVKGYDLTGASIWFKLDISGKGPGPEYAYRSVYFNGIRVAEGQHLERQLLFASAKPGEKVLIAIKLLATEYEKNLENAHLTIEVAQGRPNPEDLRAELLSAAELLPSILTKPDSLAAQEAILDAAARSVNIAALDGNDQSSFDASLRAAQKSLEPLRPTLQHYLVHMTGNAHIDAAWLWTSTETVDQVHFTFANALRLMSEYPDYTFAQSTAQYSEWMAEKFPNLFREIQQRVKEGRWELVGGMWVEPDLNMTDGESEVRQLLVGTHYLRNKFGVDVHVGWNPDSFGYNWQLPQIYKKSGIDYFLTQKLAENETNPIPLKLFWWSAPDGSRVLTYIPHDYVIGIDPIDLAGDLALAMRMNPGQDELLHLFGPSFGRLAVGTAREDIDSGLHWAQPGRVYPRVEFGTAESFFKAAAGKVAAESPIWTYRTVAREGAALPLPADGQVTIPTWNDELYLEHHRGTYTTQAKQKRNMRESEERLLNAEKYSSLAWLDNQPYPSTELTEAWKKVLFNQFHDVAAGSAIHTVYQDAEKDYDQVRWASEEASTNALQAIDAKVDTRGRGEPVVVWNPLGWKRGGVFTVDVQMPHPTPGGISVLDANNQVLPSEIVSSEATTNIYRLLVQAKDVPSLGYTVLHVTSGKRPYATDLQVNGWTMQNSYLRVTVDPDTGCITSLYDKKSQFESLAAGTCGNQLQTFYDKPRRDDAWNIDMGTLDHNAPIDPVESIKLINKGPMRATIRVTRKWQSSTFVQEITLYADSDEVDVVNDIDWHETHVLLKAAFALAAASNVATYEIPYGAIERPTTRDNSWEQAKFEVPALRWADLGDGKHGFSLINESKYGYDCMGNVLRLSLLRSPVWPDPMADKGHHHFSYALYPHDGDWKSAFTVRHGYEYNYKLNAKQVQSHTGVMPSAHSFVSLKPENLVLTAVKKAEDSDALILRFYESAGLNSRAEITVPNGFSQATEVNLIERRKTDAEPIARSGDHLSTTVSPYSINTLKIDYKRNDPVQPQ
jgi:alpha-mannosidase